MACLRELVLTIVALSLEERINALTFLTGLTLLTRKVAILDYLRHALLPGIWCQLALVDTLIGFTRFVCLRCIDLCCGCSAIQAPNLDLSGGDV